MKKLRAELFTFEGCPNREVARCRLERAIALEGKSEEIVERLIETPEDAERFRFLGSPSVRIGGFDVEPEARVRTAYGLQCRTYRDGDCMDGAPTILLIRQALRDSRSALDERATDNDASGVGAHRRSKES